MRFTRGNLPSVKTLQRVADGPREARLIRKILEAPHREALEDILGATDAFPVTRNWYNRCYHPMDLRTMRLSMANELIQRGFGVEKIDGGGRADSPAIEYVNTGDGYRETLMYVHHRGWRVGCWADIVERGKYL